MGTGSHRVDDQRALIGGQDPDLDEVDRLVGAEDQGDVVVARVSGDGDEVAQGVADVLIDVAVAVSAGGDRRLPQFHGVSTLTVRRGAPRSPRVALLRRGGRGGPAASMTGLEGCAVPGVRITIGDRSPAGPGVWSPVADRSAPST